MKDNRNPLPRLELTVDHLSQAIYTVNRHAKTAPNPKYLYKLKQESLKKLIAEGKARKVGLHFSLNPKHSQQQSDVLVECGLYSFHIPPSKNDFTELPHLGKLDENRRNPKSFLSLQNARILLQNYTGLKEEVEKSPFSGRQRHYQKPVFKKLGERY